MGVSYERGTPVWLGVRAKTARNQAASPSGSSDISPRHAQHLLLVWGSGFQVLGFRVQGEGLRVQVLGLRVEG